MSIVKFSLVIFSSLLLPCQFQLKFFQKKILYFLILKGSDPQTATMALLTANGDSLDKGLSLSVPFINKKHGHCNGEEFR